MNIEKTKDALTAALLKLEVSSDGEPLVQPEASKLDHVIDLVGELVTADTATSQAIKTGDWAGAQRAQQNTSALLEQLREAALSLSPETIINGLQVKVADTVFVLPLEQVVECVDLNAAADPQHHVFKLRGQSLPYLRLREFFELPAAQQNVRESLVVLQQEQKLVGVVVDQIVGETRALNKPLGRLFRHAHRFSGSIIQDNGHVALILDVPYLMQHINQHNASTPDSQLENGQRSAPQK